MITAKEILETYHENRKEIHLQTLDGILRKETSRIELVNGRAILYLVGNMNLLMVNALIFELISVGFSAIYLEDCNPINNAIKITIPQQK